MKIFTFNSRDNILWEVIQSHFGLNNKDMHREINLAFQGLLEELEHKKINYQNLKNVLTPQKDKMEICLVFDSSKIESTWYDGVVFKALLPYICNLDKVSVSVGDLIGDNEVQEKIYEHFTRQLIPFHEVVYRHSTQFFLIYINNLTSEKVDKLTRQLSTLEYFAGYFNFTYHSILKSYIAGTIGQQFIILGKNVITTFEYENEVKDYNLYGYSFEENGLQPIVITNSNYNSFLQYKIEREAIEGFMSDQLLSLATITDNPSLLDDYEIILEPKKFEYLKSEKIGTLSVAGLNYLTKEELCRLIRYKINSNYYFNMEFMEKYDVLKFNIMIELVGLEQHRPVKYLLALELRPEEKKLRVVTIF